MGIRSADSFLNHRGSSGVANPTTRRNWWGVIPFFQFPPEIRKINAIESLNMSLRKAIKTPGAFPSGDAARKVMFLALRNLPASRTPSKDGKRRSTRVTKNEPSTRLTSFVYLLAHF
jgi:putative transposase